MRLCSFLSLGLIVVAIVDSLAGGAPTDNPAKIGKQPDDGGSRGKLVRAYNGHTDTVTCARFFAQSTRLASSSHDGTVRIWNVNTGHLIKTLTGFDRSVEHLAATPDGNVLATLGASDVLRVWDLSKGTSEILAQAIRSVTMSTDGKLLVTGGMDAVVRVWEVGSWKELVAFKTTGKSVRSLMFSPNARILVAEGDDGTVIIWNALTRKEESRIRLESPLAVGNDRIVACPDKHMVKWIDVAAKRFQSKKLVEGSNNGARPVSQLAVSPDGKTLAAGEWKGRVRIWDLSSGKERNTLVEPGLMSYLGFNLDGTLLACCTSRSLRVWWVRDE